MRAAAARRSSQQTTMFKDPPASTYLHTRTQLQHTYTHTTSTYVLAHNANKLTTVARKQPKQQHTTILKDPPNFNILTTQFSFNIITTQFSFNLLSAQFSCNILTTQFSFIIPPTTMDHNQLKQ